MRDSHEPVAPNAVGVAGQGPRTYSPSGGSTHPAQHATDLDRLKEESGRRKGNRAELRPAGSGCRYRHLAGRLRHLGGGLGACALGSDAEKRATWSTPSAAICTLGGLVGTRTTSGRMHKKRGERQPDCRCLTRMGVGGGVSRAGPRPGMTSSSAGETPGLPAGGPPALHRVTRRASRGRGRPPRPSSVVIGERAPAGGRERAPAGGQAAGSEPGSGSGSRRGARSGNGGGGRARRGSVRLLLLEDQQLDAPVLLPPGGCLVVGDRLVRPVSLGRRAAPPRRPCSTR